MAREIPIGRLAEVLGAEIEQTMRAVKISLFNGVILSTRVDTGRLRGNWQASAGQPVDAQIERLDPSGAEAQAQVAGTVTGYGVDYLSNNLPYAEVWEERDGMVAKNVARIGRTVNEAIKAHMK